MKLNTDVSQQQPSAWQTAIERISGIVVVAAAIAVLYFGRSLLIPLTVALLLSFIVAPLIRMVRMAGINHTLSTLLSVSILTIVFLGLSLTVIVQSVHLASGLSQYQANLQQKADSIQDIGAGKLAPALADAKKFWTQLGGHARTRVASGLGGNRSAIDLLDAKNEDGQLPVEVHQPPPTALEIAAQVGRSLAGPLETTVIVFIVWIFVLLDQEGLRDRLIRLIGSNDIRRTTIAMDDAGQRLSRYFLSQFSVNLGMGALVTAGLAMIGVPSAILLGTLTAVLRFVPYVGVWIAVVPAAALAAAITPDWTPVVLVISMFVVLEALVGQVLEPLLYGHTTGLSPASVILAAIFWAGIWGPIGFILSTPLTLCLVVLGRYVEGMKFLEILLGDSPGLRLHQQFYQRVLAGDADEIIQKGRTFLKEKSFVSYCDAVVIPAIQLASTDEAVGAISETQRDRAARTAARAIEVLSGDAKHTPIWNRRKTVLNALKASAVETLRTHRESLHAQDVRVNAATPVVCIGLSPDFDEIAIEIFIRALGERQMIGQHFHLADLKKAIRDGKAEKITTVVLISVDHSTEVDAFQHLANEVRDSIPDCKIISIFHPAFFSDGQNKGVLFNGVSFQAASFEEAVQESLVGSSILSAQAPTDPLESVDGL